MCKNRRNRFIAREHAAQVFFEELKACESIKDSPGPCPSAQYTIHDLHTAAINELWDLAHLLGVDKRLHELEHMWLRKPPVLEKGVLVRLRDDRPPASAAYSAAAHQPSYKAPACTISHGSRSYPSTLLP